MTTFLFIFGCFCASVEVDRRREMQFHLVRLLEVWLSKIKLRCEILDAEPETELHVM